MIGRESTSRVFISQVKPLHSRKSQEEAPENRKNQRFE